MPLPTPQDAAGRDESRRQLAALKDQANALWAALSYQLSQRDAGRRQHMFDQMNPATRPGASRSLRDQGLHKADIRTLAAQLEGILSQLQHPVDTGETAGHLRLYSGNTPGRTAGAPEQVVRKFSPSAPPQTATIQAHDPAAELKTLADKAKAALAQIRGLRAAGPHVPTSPAAARAEGEVAPQSPKLRHWLESGAPGQRF